MLINGKVIEQLVTSVDELLVFLDISERGVAIAVNGVVIPRSEWSSYIFSEKDEIDVVTAAAGG